MLGVNGRGVARVVFTPPAKVLIRLHVTADMVTIAGTLATSVAALALFPTGHLALGSAVIAIVVCGDALDGTMARLTKHSTRWGAFLDSTLDRVADAALFAGLVFYFALRDDMPGVIAAVAAGSFGAVVPYARARAEALGMTAAGGIAERSDRLIVTLVAAFITGIGASRWVLVVALAVLSVAAAITVMQRARAVWIQGAESAAP
ncbi:MAG: CDP-alcohol phosphatidyltransferase family protein [Bifidobacteriaceae bacterium]|jgi:CDP-diacylglycerol--glycerol-3-phosphate 3-phosphatidyltransferase|nr:CDP-alcohol phosphatidyltransferase family protein [Bifidobacteriaceae bacterium]